MDRQEADWVAAGSAAVMGEKTGEGAEMEGEVTVEVATAV